MASNPLERFIDAIDPAFREGDPQVDGKSAEAENVNLLREQYLAIARGDQLGHGAVDVQRVGVAGVGVYDDRDRDARADPPGSVDQLGLGQQWADKGSRADKGSKG
jgi:hypothetical protein